MNGRTQTLIRRVVASRGGDHQKVTRASLSYKNGATPTVSRGANLRGKWNGTPCDLRGKLRRKWAEEVRRSKPAQSTWVDDAPKSRHSTLAHPASARSTPPAVVATKQRGAGRKRSMARAATKASPGSPKATRRRARKRSP